MTAKSETFTFRGKTFAETIQKVTQTLGKDAYIIEKREVKKKGALTGLLGGDQEIEIVASASAGKTDRESPRPTLLQKTYCNPAAKPGGLTPLDGLFKSPMRSAEAGTEVGGSGLAARFESIEKRLDGDQRLLEAMRDEMRMMFSLQARGGLPLVGDELMAAYRALVENDVADDIARELVEKLQREGAAQTADRETVRTALCEAIARLIETAGPIKLKESGPTVVALVGPTGVGKTTTILKLAFDFVVKRKLRVAVITEDGCRPGAREQLRSLDQFLGLPVIAADSPTQARAEIGHLADRDLILVDTAGRCPKNRDKLAELSEYLRAIGADEIHLVVSGESAERNIINVSESFRSVGFDRLVLSKLDEAASYGLILNIATKIAARLSYVTTGQDYMETFAVGDGESLARLVMGLERVEPYAATGGGAARSR